jgi:sulfotransferase family protein
MAINRNIRQRLRPLTSGLRALPSALIVGAQRAGTTALYHYLVQHPQVVPPTTKELHFFDLNYGQGLAWYREQFPLRVELARKQAITLEASPYYVFHPHALRRIKHLLPAVKIIVLLRNPVDRAVSHYFHEVEYGAEKLPMADAFREEENRLAGERELLLADESYRSFAHQHYTYRSRGVYADQIQRCFELFGPESTYIIQSEVMFSAPEVILQDLFLFLGLRPFSPEAFVRRGRMGAYRRDEVDPELYADLQAYYEPHNERLYGLLKKDLKW